MALKVRNTGLELKYREWNAKLAAIDEQVERLRDDMATGPVDVRRFWDYIDTVNKWIPALNAAGAVPGFAAYVQTQGGSATPADWLTARAAMLALRDAMGALIPVANGGLEQVITHQADHSRTYREFNTLETNPLLALCDAVTNSLT